MTATDPTPLVCPQCGGVDTSVGGSGNGMCFECAFTWDPAEVVGIARPVVEPFGMAPVGDVYGHGLDVADNDVTIRTTDDDIARLIGEVADVDTFNDRLADLVGGMATLEGGQVARVVTFTDDDRVVVTLATGDTEVVPLSDVERIVPPAPPAPEAVEAVEELEQPVEMQAMMLMASQIIEAGVKASYALSTPGSLVDIPTGYLPDDPALWAIVEQACVVAIGMLIDATDDTPAAIAGFFGITLEDVPTGDQTTEETGGERSSEEG